MVSELFFNLSEGRHLSEKVAEITQFIGEVFYGLFLVYEKVCGTFIAQNRVAWVV
jgi:hypothetical protein